MGGQKGPGPIVPLPGPPPHVVPLSQTKNESLDDPEWEYEYSTTETETQYITVDLSIPEFLTQPQERVYHSTRGSYRAWHNPMLQNDRQRAKHVSFEDDGENDEADDDEAAVDPEDDDANDEDETDEEPRLRVSRRTRNEVQDKENEQSKAQSTPEVNPKDIQILDLHSSKPIISYNGQIFSGAWADTIGTELFFATRDPSSRESVLRQLSPEVDLVAASATRITCTPAELRPRYVDEDHKMLQEIKEKHNITIPIMEDPTGARQSQATFLENLMAIKKMKGEQDEVTVNAVETRHNRVYDDPHEEEYQRQQKKQRRDRSDIRRKRHQHGSHSEGGRGKRSANRSRSGSKPERRRLVRGLRSGGQVEVESTPTPARLEDMVQAAQRLEEDEDDDVDMDSDGD